MLRFLHTIMYPHKEDFLKTVKDYIDFSQNEILWKEMDRMSGLGMSILEEGIERGEDKLARLIEILSNEHNYEAITQVTADVEVRKELYKKYGIE